MAATMSSSWSIRVSRSAQAAEVAGELNRAYLAGCVGETYPVLYEQEAEGLWTGHAPNYILVGAKGADLHNQVRRTRITGIRGNMLVGELEEDHV